MIQQAELIIRGKQRRVQRLRLEHPLAARIGGQSARILNISLYGALVEHPLALRPLSRQELILQTASAIRLQCEIRRCNVARLAGDGPEARRFHSGVSSSREPTRSSGCVS